MTTRRPLTVTLTFDECRLLARESAERAAGHVDLAQYFATTPRDGDDYSSTAAHYAREAVRVFGLSERLCVKYYGYLHLPDARGCVAEWVEDSLATIRKRRGA